MEDSSCPDAKQMVSSAPGSSLLVRHPRRFGFATRRGLGLQIPCQRAATAGVLESIVFLTFLTQLLIRAIYKEVVR